MSYESEVAHPAQRRFLANKGGSIIATSALLILALAWTSPALAETPSTLRLDYFHTGHDGQEVFAVDEVVVEPLPWPGNPDRQRDDTKLGDYFFEVIDVETDELWYSRGYSSIYAEWVVTEEASTAAGTFHESLRFPQPDGPVDVFVYKRNQANEFERVWEVRIDPADMLVNRAPPPAPAEIISIQDNGDPAHKVDLLILGDGYTADEQDKFVEDARRLSEVLFDFSPYKERRDDFNVWAMMPPSPQSGVSRPSSGLVRYSPLGTRYDAFRSERYVLTYDNKAFRTIASFAPYDAVEILVNNETYGGGGIFGMYSTAASGSQWAPYLFVHEFGHHFAALADEYYTSPVAYGPSDQAVEPWEKNVTALLDRDNLKWKQLQTKMTPLPTPWPKKEYDEYSLAYQEKRAGLRKENRPEAEMDALFIEAKAYVDELFSDASERDAVGAFEGAYYEATGYYRPALNCTMFTRHDKFCPVCTEAISEVIDLYTTR